jgi:hypothetical protein
MKSVDRIAEDTAELATALAREQREAAANQVDEAAVEVCLRALALSANAVPHRDRNEIIWVELASLEAAGSIARGSLDRIGAWMINCTPIFNHHILAFDVASFAQALVEGRETESVWFPRPGADLSDHRHRRLLRPRRERPRSRRAAEQRDELAAFCMTGKEHC